MTIQSKKNPWVPYVIPFAVFMLLTAPVKYVSSYTHFFYIAKTFIVGGLLLFWYREYITDITLRLSFYEVLISLLSGLLVLVIWVAPEKYLFQSGSHTGFNPYSFGWSPGATAGLIAVRLLGAAIVVPVMEELFWRSFILRYIINPDFRKVPLGTFTWGSFLIVVILFGFEHYRIVQGIAAGIIYTLLVIRQKNLMGPILAHGITNLGLGIYVLLTKGWAFW